MINILVLEVAESTRLLKEELGKDGYQVTLASSEEEALGILKNDPTDLIAVVNHSPKLNSIEFMRKLSENNLKTPIMLGTASGRYKQNFQVWSSRAHVVKSSDLDELKLAIKKILSQ
ncbi:MAG: response regulator [Nitrospinaceae bacterium]|jgi:DNA-binding response OmpR family regulator|nr:response regulator [Nitrospinaceae bacterium]